MRRDTGLKDLLAGRLRVSDPNSSGLDAKANACGLSPLATLPGPSHVVPFWTLIAYETKKELRWKVQVCKDEDYQGRLRL